MRLLRGFSLRGGGCECLHRLDLHSGNVKRRYVVVADRRFLCLCGAVRSDIRLGGGLSFGSVRAFSDLNVGNKTVLVVGVAANLRIGLFDRLRLGLYAENTSFMLPARVFGSFLSVLFYEIGDVDVRAVRGYPEHRKPENYYRRYPNKVRADVSDKAVKRAADNSADNTAAAKLCAVFPEGGNVKSDRSACPEMYHSVKEQQKQHLKKYQILKRSVPHLVPPEESKDDGKHRDGKRRAAEKTVKQPSQPFSDKAHPVVRHHAEEQKQREKHQYERYEDVSLRFRVKPASGGLFGFLLRLFRGGL